MAANDKKRQRIVYAIFALAVILGLYNQPWKRSKRDTGPVQATEQSPALASMTPAVAPSTALASVSDTDVPDWTVSPFRPINTKEPDPVSDQIVIENAEPRLQGTMMVGSRELCVLDGRVQRVGDKVGTWKVTKINQGAVTLTSTGGDTIELTSKPTAQLKK